MYGSDSSSHPSFSANFNQLGEVNLELLKHGHYDIVTWSKARPLACIDKITDSNVLQAMKDRTMDLCTSTSGVSGIGAGFTYATIFRFFLFIQFLLPGLNYYFLHLARPVVLLPSCLGRSFFSSRGSSFPLSLRFCLAGRRQCLLISDTDIQRAYSRGSVNSSESPYSAEFCPRLRPYFFSYYPCTESDIPQLSRGPLPVPSSRTQCGSHLWSPYQLLPSTLYCSYSMWCYSCVTSGTQRHSEQCFSAALRNLNALQVSMSVSASL